MSKHLRDQYTNIISKQKDGIKLNRRDRRAKIKLERQLKRTTTAQLTAPGLPVLN